MRMIGHLPGEVSARRFSDYLYAQGIDNQIELERDGRWALWIHAEDHIASSEGLLEQYRQNPADPKYIGAAKVADERRLREERAFESEEELIAQIAQDVRDTREASPPN